MAREQVCGAINQSPTSLLKLDFYFKFPFKVETQPKREEMHLPGILGISRICMPGIPGIDIPSIPGIPGILGIPMTMSCNTILSDAHCTAQ